MDPETEDPIIFNCGPAKLPRKVLRRVRDELLDFSGTHQSILEISHRDPEFKDLVETAGSKARKLLNVPDNYKILFMQGGGSGQYAAVPLNLIARTGKADYAVTGVFSEKSMKEACKYGQVREIFPRLEEYAQIPAQDSWELDPDASYLYYCSNETVNGVEFQYVPESGGPGSTIPLVADMSSNLFTRQIDVNKFGIIFAAAQKNFGPAGVTLVIVREDLLGRILPFTPSIFDYSLFVTEGSLCNSPFSFGICAIDRVFDWTLENGGVPEMERRAIAKSELLYNLIDESNGFYVCPIAQNCRSRMIVKFYIRDCNEELERKFVQDAKEAEFLGLARLNAGGIRVALYNAVEVEHVQKLGEFMRKFAEHNQ